MTQFQFDLICKLVQAGAPVLADELCGALQGLVQSLNALAEENEKLKNSQNEFTEADTINVD